MTARRASPANGVMPRDPLGKRWRGRLPVPPHVHPLVQSFVAHLNDQDTTITECADRTGLSRNGMSSWFCRRVPRLDNFEAALNSLDLELRIVPRKAGSASRNPQGERA